MISSKTNPQLKYLQTLLKKRSAREADRVFVCEGRKMFFEILTQRPEYLVKAYWSESGAAELADAERKMMLSCDWEIVSDAAFCAVAETVTPQGVLAIVRMPEYKVEDMIAGDTTRLLLLESLRDPGNLGTIMRTAEAAGMNGIILSADSVDTFNPKVVRSTMGAILRVPFCYAEDFPKTLRELTKRGVKLYAAHLQGSVPYTEASYGDKAGILIGNEANGLSDGVTVLSDVRIRIPMDGQAESLNAAVAAAILMYHLRMGR
ncbi:MAG: RNA methyltransferase [Lachnospiraceae bacterium]|nr:RNA methyltransferase [Lachnospiraceae bacterium]